MVYDWLKRKPYLYNRRDCSFLAVFVAPPGMGKTSAAISVCERLDHSFNSEHMIFESEQLERVLKYEPFKPNSFLLLTKFGSSLGSNVLNRYTKFETRRNEKVYFRIGPPYNLVFVVSNFDTIDRRWRKACGLAISIQERGMGRFYTMYNGVKPKLTKVARLKAPTPYLAELYQSRVEEILSKSMESISKLGKSLVGT